MNRFSDFSLKTYNTFGINSIASNVVMPETSADFRDTAKSATAPFFILGGGSNVVLPDRYEGTIIHPINKGIYKIDERGDQGCLDGRVMVEAAAGEVWANFVDYCIAQGWYGLENLAGIPGTVGASPVQNVGAYGAEAKDVIDSVHCYEIGTGNELWIAHDDCQFAYRWSRFKGEWKDCYIIDRVRFRLRETFTPNLSYKALSSAVDDNKNMTARQLADIVVSIRDSKLPNPMEIGSAGSFFKNPVVDSDTFHRLKEQYPEIVAFAVDNGGFKLAAGWLIDQCGWKGGSLGKAGVYEKQALVLVNRGGATSSDIIALSQQIISDVKAKFSITIEPEAIILD